MATAHLGNSFTQWLAKTDSGVTKGVYAGHVFDSQASLMKFFAEDPRVVGCQVKHLSTILLQKNLSQEEVMSTLSPAITWLQKTGKLYESIFEILMSKSFDTYQSLQKILPKDESKATNTYSLMFLTRAQILSIFRNISCMTRDISLSFAANPGFGEDTLLPSYSTGSTYFHFLHRVSQKSAEVIVDEELSASRGYRKLLTILPQVMVKQVTQR